MEMPNEELARKCLEGKLKILKESRRILDELYWKNLREEQELYLKDKEQYNAETMQKVFELTKKRQELIKEIRKIDDQLGL